ncbi:hypothetical protein M0802_015157 [Mischocyttarus mexicanus]|nr:hypothetical protein M0802_015157 [Mischocyttarus mexicanus]
MEDTKFKTVNLSPTCQGRPPKFQKIALVLLNHDNSDFSNSQTFPKKKFRESSPVNKAQSLLLRVKIIGLTLDNQMVYKTCCMTFCISAIVFAKNAKRRKNT